MKGYIDSESQELPKSVSIVLQGTMALSWGKVLRRRAIARREAARSARKRVIRMADMTIRRRRVLSGAPLIVKSCAASLVRGSKQRPICIPDSDEESEDEPLIRRVTPSATFRVSTFDCGDLGEKPSGAGDSSESDECSEESEGVSETESSKSDSDDESEGEDE